MTDSDEWESAPDDDYFTDKKFSFLQRITRVAMAAAPHGIGPEERKKKIDDALAIARKSHAKLESAVNEKEKSVKEAKKELENLQTTGRAYRQKQTTYDSKVKDLRDAVKSAEKKYKKADKKWRSEVSKEYGTELEKLLSPKKPTTGRGGGVSASKSKSPTDRTNGASKSKSPTDRTNAARAQLSRRA